MKKIEFGFYERMIYFCHRFYTMMAKKNSQNEAQ